MPDWDFDEEVGGGFAAVADADEFDSWPDLTDEDIEALVEEPS